MDMEKTVEGMDQRKRGFNILDQSMKLIIIILAVALAVCFVAGTIDRQSPALGHVGSGTGNGVILLLCYFRL